MKLSDTSNQHTETPDAPRSSAIMYFAANGATPRSAVPDRDPESPTDVSLPQLTLSSSFQFNTFASMNSSVPSLEVLIGSQGCHGDRANHMAAERLGRPVMQTNQQPSPNEQYSSVHVLDKLVLPGAPTPRQQPWQHCSDEASRREHLLSVLQRAMDVLSDDHDSITDICPNVSNQQPYNRRRCRRKKEPRQSNLQEQ